MLTFNIGLGNNGETLTSKTLPLFQFSLQPLLHPLIFCPDDSMPPNVRLASLLFANQLQQTPRKRESKTSAW